MADDKEAVLEKLFAWDLRKIERDLSDHWVELENIQTSENHQQALAAFFLTLASDLQKEYNSHITKEQAWQVKVWLSDDSMKRIWTALGKSMKPEMRDEIVAWAQKTHGESGPPPEWLQDYMNRFEKAWRQAERKSLLRVIFLDAKVRNTPIEKFDFATLGPEVKVEYEKTLSQQYKRGGTPMWYSWHAVNREELDKFISFLESEAGKAWESAFHNTYVKAVVLTSDFYAQNWGLGSTNPLQK